MDSNFWGRKSNTWIRTQSKRPFFMFPVSQHMIKPHALTLLLKLCTLMEEGKVARIASKMTQFGD